MIVKVCDGKYTFRKTSLVIEVDRHGEQWLTLREGFNAIHSLMAELDAARVVLAAVRAYVTSGKGTAVPALFEALEQHDALVSDTEPPSEWTRINPSAVGLDPT